MTMLHSLQDTDDLIVYVQVHTLVLTVPFQAKAIISPCVLPDSKLTLTPIRHIMADLSLLALAKNAPS
jgi:hypothetical protein